MSAFTLEERAILIVWIGTGLLLLFIGLTPWAAGGFPNERR